MKLELSEQEFAAVMAGGGRIQLSFVATTSDTTQHDASTTPTPPAKSDTDTEPTRRIIDRTLYPRLVFARRPDGYIGYQSREGESATSYSKTGAKCYQLLRRLWLDMEWSDNIDSVWRDLYAADVADPAVFSRYDRRDAVCKLIDNCNKLMRRIGIAYRVGISGDAVELRRRDGDTS